MGFRKEIAPATPGLHKGLHVNGLSGPQKKGKPQKSNASVQHALRNPFVKEKK